MKLRSAILFFALMATVALAACDSGDPIDEPEPRDVAGRYNFTQFVFEPTSTAVQSINVLDTLAAGRTSLDLSSGGNFTLRYQFQEGDEFFLSGDFSVSARSVRIDGRREDRESYNKLLLDEDFTLRRVEDEAGVLTAEIAKTINPAAFSDRYEGINSLSGTLKMRLVKE